MRRSFLILLLLLLLCTATAKAFILAAPEPSLDNHTIEALTAVSPLILTATIDKEYVVFGHDQIDIQPVDILKAPTGFVPPKPLSAYFQPINHPGGVFAAAPWPPVGTKILIFLTPDRSSAPTWEIYDFVILDPPGISQSANSPVIRDLTFDPIPDAQQVLAIVQQEVRRTPPTTAVETFTVYPFRFDHLPADDRLLPTARLWTHSNDPLARYLAVNIMAAHPDPQDVPLLTALLQDPYFYDLPINLSPWSGHEYFVRQAAAKALAARGIAVPPTVLSTPRHGLYQPFSLLPFAAFFAVPLFLWVAALWFVRRKLLQQRLSLKQMTISCLTCLCLLTVVLTAFLWYRSNKFIDDVVYARNGTQIEITSLRGLLFVVVGKPWPAETPPCHLSIDQTSMHGPPDDRYFFERMGFGLFYWYGIWDLCLFRNLSYQFRLGFEFFKFPATVIEPFTSRSGIRQTYSGNRFVCSYPTLILLFLAFPMLRLILALFFLCRRLLRARRTRKLGLCPTCSYDLRAHHPGDRCPECGTVIAQVKPPNSNSAPLAP